MPADGNALVSPQRDVVEAVAKLDDIILSALSSRVSRVTGELSSCTQSKLNLSDKGGDLSLKPSIQPRDVPLAAQCWPLQWNVIRRNEKAGAQCISKSEHCAAIAPVTVRFGLGMPSSRFQSAAD